MNDSAEIAQFMPHGMCYLWNVRMLALHVISDAVIAIAYFSIPIILLFFVRKRSDLPFPGVFAMFGLFIVSCGMTHVLDIWTIWHPTYWLSGGVKAFTACVSIATAVLLVRIIPRALSMKGRADLKRLAATDPLTGLPNRRAFDRILDREWRAARETGSPVSIIMIDLDYFKEYNDYYGHLAGDECLKVFAELLRKNARRPGDFVARYGGEEFIMLLPATSREGASHIAEILCDAVRDANIAHKNSPLTSFITASFGVAALIPDREATALALVAAADAALYAAKNTGRNQVA